jgi:NAD(P)-dependent dehydrogenase (short-subunit alcohol dehydrogenase family)
MPIHPTMTPGAIAVVTGAASGIGRAAAERLSAEGLTVALIDRPGEKLSAAASAIPNARAYPADVADGAAMLALASQIRADLGEPQVLMNNAGIGPGSSCLGDTEAWDRTLAVNLWGPIHGCRAFVPLMIGSGRPGLVINTGSKQGITTPPGNPAYNVSKAGVKVYTEALQHELRNTPGCAVTAHLLIPGFVFTGMTSGATEKPPGAWTPAQTIDFMMESLSRGDFYILCPDNDVTRAIDEKRIAWAAGDIVENRPPLSRWHPDFKAAFADWLASAS